MKIYNNLFKQIVSLENVFYSWEEFKADKQKKRDVINFEFNLERNIFSLQKELKNKTYRHGQYKSFFINDPKLRNIHKAPVRDRIVHHTLFRILNPILESTFVYDSYSCRIDKGTHRGVKRLAKFCRMVSKNNKGPCFILKCDVKQFFKSIDHEILFSIIKKKVKDNDALWLIQEIIESFSSGLPLGNLTSQLFANIYLNGLDQFVKQELKIPFYIRYTDDFVIISADNKKLNLWLTQIEKFLSDKLKLKLHPDKIVLHKYHQGMDFLGYIQFPHYRILRTKTRRRIAKKIKRGVKKQAMNSYLGVLSHANEYRFGEEIKNLFWLNHKK